VFDFPRNIQKYPDLAERYAPRFAGTGGRCADLDWSAAAMTAVVILGEECRLVA
jgi:hypothetical protein